MSAALPLTRWRRTIDFVRVLLATDGRPPAQWLFELTLLASVAVLVLHATTAALAAQSEGRLPMRELLMFVLAVGLHQTLMQRASLRVLDATTEAVGALGRRTLAATRRLDLRRFEAIGPDTFVARLGDDASRVVPGSSLVILLAVALLTVAFAMLYVAWLSPRAALVTLAVMVAVALFVARLERQAGEIVGAARRGREALRRPIDDLVAGFAQVKQHGPRGEALAAAFEAESRHIEAARETQYRDYYAREAIGRQGFFALLGLIGFVVPAIAPDAADRIGDLVIAVAFVFRPVATVIMAMPQLAAVGDAWERLRAFADTVEAEAAPPTPSRPASPATFTELALDGVTFSWPSTPSRRGFLVGPIDFTLAPGEVVFITGQNGSGKSTFVKLLCGLYARDGGVMRVDGVEQPPDPGPAWRERFAAVFAEFVLFERLHGFADVDPARVSALLAEMELDGKVRFADGRFDTLALSTGQRKRLALVVALLHDRPIYVFDEWAADQDPHFRERFYRQIVPALRARGKAVVAVTHDDDAFDACDRRIHFTDGEVVAP